MNNFEEKLDDLVIAAFDQYIVLCIILALLVFPYCYMLVSTIAKAWFDRKLKHHHDIINSLKNGE